MKLILWVKRFFKRKRKERTTEMIQSEPNLRSYRLDEYYCDEYHVRRYDDWHMDEGIWRDKYRC